MAGNIGAGKTTAAKLLSQHFECDRITLYSLEQIGEQQVLLQQLSQAHSPRRRLQLLE